MYQEENVLFYCFWSVYFCLLKLQMYYVVVSYIRIWQLIPSQFHYISQFISGKLGSKRKTKLQTVTGTNPSLDQLLRSRLLISAINRTVSLFVSKKSPWQSMQFFSLISSWTVFVSSQYENTHEQTSELVLCLCIHLCVDFCTWAFKHLPSLESDLPHPLYLTDRGESLRYQTGYWKKHISE